MNLLQLLFSFGPLLGLIILLLIKRFNSKTIINGLFYGLIVFLFVMIYDAIISGFFLRGYTQVMIDASTIFVFLTAALPEELSKFICIKLAKGRSKADIFANAMLIAFFFKAYEDFMYFTTGVNNIALTRLLLPGHVLFGLVMALFLIKGKDSKLKPLYNILGLIIPIVLHTLFNRYVQVGVITSVIGIVTYLIVIIKTLRLSKEGDTNKPKLLVLKIIVLIISFIVLMLSMTFNSVKFNTSSEITKGVSLKVVGTAIENGIYKYVCINTVIKNDTNKNFELNIFNFKLYGNDSKEPLNTNYLSDYEVEANSTKEIEVCYENKYKEYKYLRYKSISIKNQDDPVFFDIK